MGANLDLLTKLPNMQKCDKIGKNVGATGMQLKLHMVTIEDLVPRDHLLRKLESALDLTFVYEESACLYSRKYGRPPIDPV